VSRARKNLDELLDSVSTAGGFGYEQNPTDEEIDAKLEEVRKGIERWENMSPRQRAYSEFMASPEWRTLRNRRLQLDGYICQDCGGGATRVHHIWYPKEQHWKETPLWALISLCEDCHTKAHRIFDRSVPWGIHDDTP
jgi:5-methylcytosine-specific restriction endonuclease McrA